MKVRTSEPHGSTSDSKQLSDALQSEQKADEALTHDARSPWEDECEPARSGVDPECNDESGTIDAIVPLPHG